MTQSLLIIWLVSVLTASSTPATLTNARLDLVHYSFQEAARLGVNPEKFIQLIECESRWKSDALGDFRSETKEFMASGPLQWWRSSFDMYSKKYGLKGDYKNPYDQVDLALLVLKDGGHKNWYNCMKFIK